jgi:predicted transcriptional regulator of viral defense system
MSASTDTITQHDTNTLPDTAERRVLRLAEARGVLRPRDLAAVGIAPGTLARLVEKGRFERTGRGLYVAVDAQLTEHHSLVEASARVPHGVVCLLSALRFHELTTQNPFEVWIAIGVKARQPRPFGIPLRVVRFSGPALTDGIEEHRIEAVPVRVYVPAKTVADCFKYRNKIGLDVALEALRETVRQRRATIDEIWHYAGICRVANIMRPYLESLA